MPKSPRLYHPSLESSTPVGAAVPQRQSLFDTKDDFIHRIAPVGVAAIYFGSFTLSSRDLPLSRQALFKLSYLYNQFLHPAGVRIDVNRQTAVLSGTVESRSLIVLAEILALQIEGIRHVQNQMTLSAQHQETAADVAHFLLATDQTLRASVTVSLTGDMLVLEGEVSNQAQKSWAEHLVEGAGGTVDSRLVIREALDLPPTLEPISVDDESLQALVLFRLRLARETEHLPLRVKATRGVVSIVGKVRTEALRQRAEGIARSTLGLRELRSSISIAA